LCEKARAGKLRRIGAQGNLVDVIYIDNAAEAHCQALDHLTSPASAPAGRAFFLGQSAPVNLWDFIDRLLAACGEKPIVKSLPFSLAYALGGGLELLYRALGWYRHEPAMTRFLALQLSTSHYFDHRNAAKAFGYFPRISIDDGLAQLINFSTPSS
jgi:nucleoside-diphosphate-sugar epimerase